MEVQLHFSLMHLHCTAGPWCTRSLFGLLLILCISNDTCLIQSTFPYLHTHTQRNGTLPEVYTIHTGHSGMDNFGYYDRINGADTLPFWPAAPCNSIKASEGSLFPPRDVTGLDTVFVYDKDVCRTLPFTYKRPVIQNGMWEAFKLKLRWSC